MLNFSDKVSTSAVRKTSDGYLVADAAVARTGIQEYLGREVGKPEMQIVRVYRPAEQVFAKDAMKTYAHRPMTNDHPKQSVTSENWKDVAIGQTGGDVMRDGEFVRVPLVLMDQKAITDWEEGKVELSMGYSADIVFQAGVTDSGEEYDAIQTNLHMNHLALVDKARGGDKLRIGDSGSADIIHPAQPTNEGGHMADNTRKVMFDGLEIEVTPQGAQAIEKLTKQVSDAKSEVVALADSHKAVVAAKDTEIGELTAKLKDAEGKFLSDADIDARVAKRAELVAKATAVVADSDYTGKSDSEIRKLVVAKKLGDSVVDGKSDEFVAGCFAMLADSKDSVADAVKSDAHKANLSDSQSEYEARLRNAHKEVK